ncbi:MAG: hypothetical protein K2H18_01790 [Muribaculaceae bacterium]|nr:hypothetical protein [Muribaculaceae bacterium]
MACTPTKPPQDVSALQDLVKDYLTRKHEWDKFPDMDEATSQEWHDIYLSSLEDMTDFICGEKNTTKVPDGPEYILNSHQWYLGYPRYKHVVNEMAENLKDIGAQNFENFEQLIDYVKEKKVKFFGDTSVYDIALRYGWNQNPPIKPEKFVYIHSKPWKAAKHLVEHGYLKKIKKLENLERKMELEKYQELLLPGMTASDVENFLCCYHKDIIKLK